MKDVMLDLETLGNGKNSALCQIGACYFDRHTGVVGETFKINVDVISTIRSGADLDGETVYWWLNQSEEARQSILAEPRIDINIAVILLNEFLAKENNVIIWSHATFDFVTIMETYKRLQVKPTFSFRSARDIRTLVDLAKVSVKDVKRDGVHHDALADCLHQVKYCVEAFNRINKLKKLGPILEDFIK
jgi:hypothetical protein